MRYFEGLRVVEITQGWVGPMICRILAELGADVIKVERTGDAGVQGRPIFLPRNDLSGDFWNRGIYFSVRNLSKRSVMIDAHSPDGHDLVLRLLEAADVLVENFQPKVMERMGLGWSQLHERFPRLVMVAVSGYGQDGPHAGRPANGVGMEPSCGVASVTGYIGGAPLKTGQTWIDPYSGLHGAALVLAGLLYRERTGRGQFIDVSMQETAIATLAPFVADYRMNGRLHPSPGNRRPGMVRGTYPCRGDDDWVSISIRTEEEWRCFCEATAHAGWMHDPRFAARHDRWHNHDALDDLIAAWTAPQTKFEVAEMLQAAGVPAAPVLKADEVLADPQLAARQFFDTIPVGDFGRVPLQRSFTPKVDREGMGARSPAPRLGEHTYEVLRDLGLSEEELEQLKEQQVIDGEPDMWTKPTPHPGVMLPYERYQEMGSILRIDRDYKPYRSSSLRSAGHQKGRAMDWSDTPEQVAFRAEVRKFFEEKLPPRYKEKRDSVEPYVVTGTYGEPLISHGASWDADRLSDDPEIKGAADAWAQALAERGWVAAHWPKELGGAGFTTIEQFIFNEEREAAGAPRVGGTGAMFLGNLLMVYGTEEQKARWMPPISRGEINWMQGYSEPGSGSDLASLQLRAVRDGDDYVLNGQKIWGNPCRSEAAYVLVRTDPEAPKHKGISFLMVEDLRAPGITGRAIRNPCGDDGNGETFFSDARVPVANRIGEENQGWYVSMTLMDFDRGSLSDTAPFKRELDNIREYIATPEGKEISRTSRYGTVRAEVADRYTEVEVGRNLARRVVWMQAAGLIPNYEASIGKCFSTETQQRVARTGTKVLGLYGQLWCESPRVPLGGYFSDAYMRTTAYTVYGGSSEIQRGVIASRGLGLPRG